MLDVDNLPTYEPQDSSGATTKATDPVMVLMIRPPTYWSAEAERKLNEGKYRTGPLLQDRIKQAGLTTLLNEADVKYASAHYLIGLIESILDIEYGDRIRISSEKSEKDEEGHIQIDLVFHQPETQEIIAVLEYKRRGFLRRIDFSSAFASTDVEREKKLSKAVRKPLLQNNGLIFSKQAAAYATDSQTRFVALFDWDTMAVFDFNNPSDDNVGEVAFGTWVEENGGQATFRKVLLGWVLKACQEKGVPCQ